MALYTSLASLSQTAASNVADGAVDAPSTIDQQTNLLASFIAQLRDGNGFTTGVGYTAQCRLNKSGSNLVLQRYDGAGLTINGVTYSIPSAGVSLAPTGSAGTTYYIYAYMNAGTMTLEASTTTHATDSTTGIEIKSGDASRTLVGMARPTAGPAWTNTTNQRFVLSWFNRFPLYTYANFTTNRTTTLTTLSEVNTEIRNEFLTWASGHVDLSIDGLTTNDTTAGVSQTAIAIDGAQSVGYCASQAYTASAISPCSCRYVTTLSEGYHYATLFSATTSGTQTLYQGGAAFSVTSLKGFIVG
jgi:hypothetical protein